MQVRQHGNTATPTVKQLQCEIRRMNERERVASGGRTDVSQLLRGSPNKRVFEGSEKQPRQKTSLEIREGKARDQGRNEKEARIKNEVLGQTLGKPIAETMMPGVGCMYQIDSI